MLRVEKPTLLTVGQIDEHSTARGALLEQPLRLNASVQQSTRNWREASQLCREYWTHRRSTNLMKFPGGWQVEVVRPGNAAAYADINHGVDKYVVGVPGQPFEVRVTAPAQQLHAYPQIRVELTVEGRSPNVCYTLTGSQPSGIFKGFVNTVKGQHLTNQFVFGKAERDAAAPATAPGTSKTGGLQVKISQVQQLPGHADPAKHRSYQATSASKAVEGQHCCAVSAFCKKLQSSLGSSLHV